jgi:hypothetical protein
MAGERGRKGNAVFEQRTDTRKKLGNSGEKVEIQSNELNLWLL